MKQSTIKLVSSEQKDFIKNKKDDLDRDLIHKLAHIPSHALIISGVRRCGKSTFLYQLAKNKSHNIFFLNFEDVRLFNFQVEHFELLDQVIAESGQRVLFFDEIQIIEGWELFVRQKLDQGFEVVITGSNASMLSSELGTKLTGRHISKELFPFSYAEYLRFTKQKKSEKSFSKYIKQGGFPQFIKTKQNDILATLIDDIMYRDIAVRYSIRDIQALKKLCSYILSNSATLVVPSKLKQTLGINAASTILNYFSYFENTYLMNLMPKFSWSVRSQLLAPKKMYVIDSALIKAGSTAFNKDKGRLLETMVYWAFRRKHKTLYYFNENNAECDFVVPQADKTQLIAQVCWELTLDNEKRELNGLMEALKFFDCTIGYIITYNNSDLILKEGKEIRVVPFYDFFDED
ncbi:MAG: ATP-binding protein [Flavobacteriales bacterium]